MSENQIENMFFFGERTISEHKEDLINDFITKTGMLQSQPEITKKIIELSNDENVSIAKIEKVIDTDPVIASKILKIANSSFYSLSREVTSLKRAILILGISMIKDIALSISILDMFKTKNKGILNELWNHAIGSSIAAKLLSVNFSEEIDTESCFTSGLLHSIGKLVMGKDERYREIFKAIDKEGLDKGAEKEEEIFGFTSAELGSIMAQKWDFSSEMVYIILNIYDAQKIINVDQSFLSVPPQYVWNTAIVSLAARAATFVGIGSEPVDCIPENLVQFLRFNSKEEFEEKFIPNFKETFFREKSIFV